MMPKIVIAARMVLGLIFFVYGINGFLQFMPLPSMPPKAMAFLGGLAAGQYFFPMVMTVQTVAGAALLAGYFVPLALAALAPVVANIFLIHLFLAPSGIPHSIAIGLLELFLVWAYRDAFRPLFRPREPGSVAQGNWAYEAHE